MEIHGFFFFLISTLLLPSPSLSQSPAASPCSSRASSSSKRVFSTCAALPHLSASLHWTLDPSTSLLSLAFAAPTPSAGWLAWAINPIGDGMAGAQTLIAFRDDAGAIVVKTYNITGYGPLKEGPIGIDVADVAGEYVGSEMRIFARMKLARGTTKVNGVWQVGDTVKDGVPAKHSFALENLEAKGVVDLVKGGSVGSGGGGSSLLKKKNIHGVLNAVSWGILLPLGAIIARYLKTFNSADPAWFYLHVSCQLIGYAVGVAGWATGLNLGSKSKGIEYTTHRNIGITLFALGTVQLFALLLRPNKDHKYRLYWNIYHHSVGYTVIVLGVVNVFKGLEILQLLHKWKEAYIVLICILGGIAVLLEVVTWIIVVKRKSDKSSGLHDGANGANGRPGA